MERRIAQNAFYKLNPLSNFCFFMFVTLFTMLMMNPITSMISFVCAFAVALNTTGRKAFSLLLKFIIPTAVAVSVLNPLLNHEGATIIMYLPSGNPMTAEAMIFGFISAITLGAVTLWFSSMHAVMTSDKFVYLFGKTAPSLGLLLSMTLKFLPQFVKRLKEVSRFDKDNNSERGIKYRIRQITSRLSAVITWALENSIITSESMKSRGYGLKGRSFYSTYRIRREDVILLSASVFTAVILIVLGIFGGAYYRYYPTFKLSCTDALSVAFYILLFVYMLTPVYINIREEIIWKKSQSAI